MHVVPPDPLTASITRSGKPVAGSEFTLICHSTETISGLTNMPTAIWNVNGELVTSGNDITVAALSNDTVAIATVTFDPLRASHGKVYRCVGDLMSPAQEESIQETSEELVTVHCKQDYSDM